MKPPLAASVLLAVAVCLGAQAVPLDVDQISNDGSPAQKEVHSLLLDRTGYLWIGSQQGLARYDGYRVVPFRILGADGVGLPVRSICQAPDSRLWLATPGGLVRFDPESGVQDRFRHHADRPDTISADDLTYLHVSSALPGRLWVASAAGTLDELDMASGRLWRRIPASPPSPLPSPGRIHVLSSDPAGVLWIGAANGLYHFLPQDGSLKTDPLPAASPGPRRVAVRSIFADPLAADTLWLGGAVGLLRFGPAAGSWESCLEGAAHDDPVDAFAGVNVIAPFPGGAPGLLLGTDSGLFHYEPRAKRCRRVPLFVDGKVLQAVRVVQTIYRDPHGIYWIGSRGEGLCKWSPLRKKFFSHLPFDDRGMKGVLAAPRPNPLANWVTSMQELGGSEVLLTTYGGGLMVFDRRNNSLRRLLIDPIRPGRKLNFFITDSRWGRDGSLWLLTAEGLARCSASGRLLQLHAFAADSAEAETIVAFAFILDRDGFAWIATDRGLVRLDPRDGGLRRYRHERLDPRSLCHDRVNIVMEDASGSIWAGTEDGLSLYQPRDDRFANFRSSSGDPQSLASSQVNFITQDSLGRVWVCTSGGLDRMEKAGGKVVFRHCPVPGFDPGQNLFRCLVEDGSQRYWAATSAGLARFDSARGTFTFYDRRDGVEAEGMAEAFFGMRSRDGEMFFSGRFGFIRFRPAEIAVNLHPPPLVSTGYRIYDNREDAAAGELVSFQLPSSRIPKDKVVRIEFAALDFVRPEKNQYAFRLEGRDKDWTYQGTRRVVDLVGLGIGRYRLHVKAANNEGVWNEIAVTVPINVRVPLWERWRFLILAALLLAVLAAVVFWSRRRSRRLLRAAVPDNLDRVLEKFAISKREAEIVRLLLAGKSNKEIEDTLFIAMATVKIHVHNIFRKVKVNNRLQLVLRIQQESKKLG